MHEDPDCDPDFVRRMNKTDWNEQFVEFVEFKHWDGKKNIKRNIINC
jgi:hypothetical protein